MVPMKISFKDIFLAPRIGLGLQRLWLQSVGFLMGYAAYLFFTYAALMLSGHSLYQVWTQSGLFPCVWGAHLTWAGWAAAILAWLTLGIAMLLTACSVSRATYMMLKGNRFYTWQEAFSYGWKKQLPHVLGAPSTIAVIAGITVVAGAAIGLVSKLILPVGAITMSLLTPLWLMSGLFLLFVLTALFLSLVLTPAVMATTDDDAFEAIFQSFSIIHAVPLRFVFYEILTAAVAVGSFLILAFAAKVAWGLTNTVVVLGMGKDYAHLSYQATALVQNWIYPAVAYVRAVAGPAADPFFFSQDFMLRSLPAMHQAGALVTAVFLLFAGGIIVSYGMAVWNAGQTVLFLLIKKHKENTDLLAREDNEEAVKKPAPLPGSDAENSSEA